MLISAHSRQFGGLNILSMIGGGHANIMVGLMFQDEITNIT